MMASSIARAKKKMASERISQRAQLCLRKTVVSYLKGWLQGAACGLCVTLSPDENEISLYMIPTCLNIQVTRIQEVITEDERS